MAYHSLEAFINKLESARELERIDCFADPVLEIAEICDRISKSPGGGKALLFNDTGTDFPLLINSMGSLNRICMALGVKDLNDISERIESLFTSLARPKDTFFDKLGMLPMLGKLSGFFPQSIKGRGKCQEVIHHEPDLSIFPVLKTWPYDGGRFFTLPIVHTINPETGMRNAGMYRMQVFDKKTTGMHWHKHKTGESHYGLYKKMGLKMPVAVALGGDPVYSFSATAPLPENLDEYLFAGFLRSKSVKMVKCVSIDMEVPADADIIIEGYVDPAEEKVLEGPFGDHTGFYSLEDYYPRFHVSCITHKKDAIYPATLVGIPPQEDAWIAKATERIFFMPIRKTVVPELVDIYIPHVGVAHNLTIVKIEKSYAGQARKVMNALWGAGQMMFNKVLLVADENFDIHNTDFLLNALRKISPEKDILFSSGPLDVLDHSAYQIGYGGKLGIDICFNPDEDRPVHIKVPLYTDEAGHAASENLFMTDIRKIYPEEDKKGVFIAAIKKSEGYSFDLLCDLIMADDIYLDFSFFIFTDENVHIEKEFDLIWYVLSNMDPMSDIVLRRNSKNNVCLCLDGTSKTKSYDEFHRSWPNVLVMDELTIHKVDSRWNEYGIGEFISSPSLRYKHLRRSEGPAFYRDKNSK